MIRTLKLGLRKYWPEYEPGETAGEWKARARRELAARFQMKGPPFEVSTDRQIETARNSMVLGLGCYPMGMDDCTVVGLNGGCAASCPVFKRGKCPEPDGIE